MHIMIVCFMNNKEIFAYTNKRWDLYLWSYTSSKVWINLIRQNDAIANTSYDALLTFFTL